MRNVWHKCVDGIITKCFLPYVGLSMLTIAASISGASERESSCERQHKISDFFFGNFSDPISVSDGGAA